MNKGTSDLNDNVNKCKKSLNDVSKTSMKPLNNGLKKTASHLTTIGKKAGGAVYKGLKKVAGISFKALMAGIGAAATAVGGMVAKSVSAYAEFEQLKGGVSTLFGTRETNNVKEYAKLVGKTVSQVKGEYKKLKGAENLVYKNANDAYKTAGMSANQYMETITTFAAALTNSLGGDTVKGAKLADMAIKDMAD